MAWDYSDEAKAARMEAVCDLIEGGAIEIGTAKMATLLARIALPPDCCDCSGSTLTCTPLEGGFALGKGKAVSARVVDAQGKPVIDGLTVGRTGADVTLDYPDLVKGQIVTLEKMSFTHA
jgi:hypothetical protein